MIHPHTELRFISREIGYGVVATSFIPKGTITWVLDALDRTFSPEQVESLGDAYRSIIDTYCFRNNQGDYVLCWDHARYVNHSFKSNCLSTAYDFEIAVRDIHPGEQLTDDYGYLNIAEPFRGIDEGTRRKTVYPDDLLRYHNQWDKQVYSALKLVKKVEQPLQHLLAEQALQEVNEIVAGKGKLQSILHCYYAGSNGQQAHGLRHR